MSNKIDILEFDGPGYSTVMKFGAWRVAIINYCEHFDPKTPLKLERHMETDEVFVLLDGNATLIIGEEKKQYVMEKNKVYNVLAGTWHHIHTDEQAKVLIVENEDTGMANTEYLKCY